VTATVTNTGTTLVTQTPTPTSTPTSTQLPWALGGFDTLSGEGYGDPVFYTDRNSSIANIVDTSSPDYWQEADPFEIIGGIAAGSPVQAVLDPMNQVRAGVSRNNEMETNSSD